MKFSNVTLRQLSYILKHRQTWRKSTNPAVKSAAQVSLVSSARPLAASKQTGNAE